MLGPTSHKPWLYENQHKPNMTIKEDPFAKVDKLTDILGYAILGTFAFFIGLLL